MIHRAYNPPANIMKWTNFRNLLLFLTSCLAQFIVLSDVANRAVGVLTLIIWIVGIVFLYLSFPFHTVKSKKHKEHSNTNLRLFTFVVIIIVLILRIVPMLNTYIFHTDEYLTAYFSYTLPSISRLDWFGVYPPAGVWVSQFPIAYFFIQKIFFNIFGLGTFAMRVSVIPYIIAVVLFLYLTARKLFNDKIALIALAIFAFFSPDLYLSRWALHFISSTAFFLAATYFFICAFKNGKKIYYGLLGFTLGLCYMTYYSSYIAFPLLVFYFAILVIKKEIKLPTIKNFVLSLMIYVYTFSPLIFYAIKVDNFFIQRTDQVKLINGSWSPYQNISNLPADSAKVLVNQFALSIQSLYTDNIGGQGGYFFGKFALFDKVTFIFLLLSFAYFLVRIFILRETQKIFLLTSVSITFFTGVVLTMPPPALHRMSIIFPFLTLIAAVTLYDIYSLTKKFKSKIPIYIFLIWFIGIIIGNTSQFIKIINTEDTDNPDYPKIENYLNRENKNFVYIAAFPSYGLHHWLLVRSGGKIYSETNSLEKIVTEIEQNHNTPLVILYPNEASFELVMKHFPNSKIVGQYIWHLLVNVN
jgi:4-amino-4-deoxy-L-arabinose transferase-like glycosyltransferase